MGLKILLALWLAAAQTPAPTYQLTVRMGRGSGVYACGAVVTIAAPSRWLTLVRGDDGLNHPSALVTFDHWDTHGWDDPAFWPVARQFAAAFAMPCHDVTLDPTYR
jgi:hypothetical protein